MKAWTHVPLVALKKSGLNGTLRFACRYSLPLHQHGGVSYLVCPPTHIFRLALRDYNRKPFHFCELDPQIPLVDKLLINTEAYHHRPAGSPFLGRPLSWDVAVVALERALTFEGPPPLEPTHPPEEDVLAAPGVPLVFTSTGWRPKAGSFRWYLKTWQQHRDLIPHRVIATISTGAWLHWERGVPSPLWLQNHSFTVQQEEFINSEVMDLLRTGAVAPYNYREFGLPSFIGPLNITEDSSGSRRLLWDPRYPNAYLDIPPLRLEQLSLLSLLMSTNALLLKLDLRAGYHHVKMAPSTAPYLAFCWFEMVFYWVALPFGLATAPAIFEGIMVGMRLVLRQMYLLRVFGYLDDHSFVLPDAPVEDAAQLVQALRDHEQPSQAAAVVLLMLQFGGVLNLRKLQAGRHIEIIGIVVGHFLLDYSIWPSPSMESTHPHSGPNQASVPVLAG